MRRSSPGTNSCPLLIKLVPIKSAPAPVVSAINRVARLAAQKEKAWNPVNGDPVVIVAGQHPARSGTAWTRCSQLGAIADASTA